MCEHRKRALLTVGATTAKLREPKHLQTRAQARTGD